MIIPASIAESPQLSPLASPAPAPETLVGKNLPKMNAGNHGSASSGAGTGTGTGPSTAIFSRLSILESSDPSSPRSSLSRAAQEDPPSYVPPAEGHMVAARATTGAQGFGRATGDSQVLERARTEAQGFARAKTDAQGCERATTDAQGFEPGSSQMLDSSDGSIGHMAKAASSPVLDPLGMKAHGKAKRRVPSWTDGWGSPHVPILVQDLATANPRFLERLQVKRWCAVQTPSCLCSAGGGEEPPVDGCHMARHQLSCPWCASCTSAPSSSVTVSEQC